MQAASLSELVGNVVLDGSVPELDRQVIMSPRVERSHPSAAARVLDADGERANQRLPKDDR